MPNAEWALMTNGEMTNGEMTNGEMTNGEMTNGEMTNAVNDESSLVAQTLRRIQFRGLTRGVDGRDEADQDRCDDDGQEVEGLEDEGDVRNLVHVDRNVNQLEPVQEIDRQPPEHRAEERSGQADDEPLEHEDAPDAPGRRAHRLQDRDVARLLHHEQHERGDDVDGRHRHDQADRDAD